jgi:hypothetical protein
MWQILDHEYHERLNKHDMVLDRRADIEHHNTMIYTMKKFAWRCQLVPAGARHELGNSCSYKTNM